MRVLEHGYRILGAPTDYPTIGVDHDFDVPIVENILRTDPVQRALYEQAAALIDECSSPQDARTS